MRRLVGGLATMGVLAMAGGCMGLGEGQGPGDNVEVSSETLYLYGSKWPWRAIPVCVSYEGATTDADRKVHEAFIQKVHDAIENTWGRVADLRFTSWAECSSDTSQSRIHVHTMSAGRSQSGVGYTEGAETNMWLNVNSAMPVTPMHEFGHALGFHHEFTRSDWNTSWGASMACKQDSDCTSDNYGHTCLNGYCREPGGTEVQPEADINSVMAATYINNTTDGNTNGVADPRVSLSAYDVLGAQKLYGRKPAGSIVGLGGRCMNIKGGTPGWGTPIVGWPCAGSASDTWNYSPVYSQLMPVYSADYALNVSGGSVSSDWSPTPLITWGNQPGANEEFRFENVQFRAMGNMCLLATGNTDGAAIALGTCSSVNDTTANPLERWSVSGESGNERVNPSVYTKFQLANTSLCMTVADVSLARGSELRLKPCVPGDMMQAFRASGGVIRTSVNPDRCFNVLGGTDAVGQRLGLWDGCGAVPSYANETFFLTGQIKSLGQCIDMLGGSSYNGVDLGMYPCVNKAANQEWDFYWK